MSVAPLIPADVDLRGLEYMPLFGNHLFGSEFNAAATDSEWRAAVTLWWAAWNQVPAGSLPDDDVALCRLADLGRDLRAWRKLKSRALHGFVHCDDGRLYHEFLCSQALIAWEKRVKERERKAKWRADREQQKQSHTQNVPRDRTRTETGTGIGTTTGQDADTHRDVPADGNRRDGTGRDGTVSKTKTKNPEPPSSRSDTSVEARANAGVEGKVSPEAAMAIPLRDRGVQITSQHPTLLSWIRDGFTPQQAIDAVGIARIRKPHPEPIPAAYLDKILRQPQIASKPMRSVDRATWRPDEDEAEEAHAAG